MSYQDENAKTIDRWVEEGWEWGVPISHEVYAAAKAGDWSVLLTPTKPVPKHWFGDLRGKRVLGLASGGGQQMPIFAALGAECWLLDYSGRQVESDRMVAGREGYVLHSLQADMSKPLPYGDNFFDLIFHPVSNCYIREVLPVWRECFRVLKPGGRLLAGLDNGTNFLFDDDETDGRVLFSLPFDPIGDPELLKQYNAEEDGYQFSHGVEEQIGGQLQAGFRLLEVYDDTNGSGFLHEHGVPCFWATLAEKEA